MKSLLIRLTHGLYKQDVTADEHDLIASWQGMKLLTYEDGKYQFSSQYRAGTVTLVQTGGAY